MRIMEEWKPPVAVLYDSDNSIPTGLNIRAATLDHLVSELLDKFDGDNGSLGKEYQSFVNTFLQMHKWFTTSSKILALLAEKSGLDRVNLELPQSKEIYVEQCCCANPVNRELHNKLSFRDSCLRTEEDFWSETNKKSEGSLRREASDPVINFVEYREDIPRCLSADSQIHQISGKLNQKLKRYQSKVSRKVCFAIRYWMENYPVHFDKDTVLFKELQEFKDSLYDENTDLYHLLDPSNLTSYAWMRKLTLKTAGYNPSKSESSLVFQQLGCEELARHLTAIDFKSVQRISFGDYERYARTGSVSDISCLERSIRVFNGLTQWVQLMILSRTTSKQRAAVMTKFIKVSQCLLKLNNFNSLMAIIGGITHSSLARLHKTHSHLSTETQKALSELSSLISSTNNYQMYRKHQMEAEDDPHAIPIIGIHLKDLIAVHSSLPDKLHIDSQLINFKKMSQLSQVITLLTKLQDERIEFCVNNDLIDTLKLALDVFYSEEEIFELSLAREPRTNGVSTPPSSSDKNIFSDWLAGVAPPDKATIDKHVNNMVVALFKNYDTDKDGYISLEEFETIISNFPFMESFCVIDSNKDGLLSKDDIKRFFRLAKCNSLHNSYKHNFTETTYFKPAYCEHCSGLLWGLIKQGFKCKDCGVNAHKSCKDIIALECKHRQQNSLNKSTSMFLPQTQISPLSTPDNLSKEEKKFTFAPIRRRGLTRSFRSINQKQKSTQTDVALHLSPHMTADRKPSPSRLQQLQQLSQTDQKSSSQPRTTLEETITQQNEELKILRRRLGMMRHYTSSILSQSEPLVNRTSI